MKFEEEVEEVIETRKTKMTLQGPSKKPALELLASLSTSPPREQPTVSQIFKGTFLKVDYPGTPFNQLLGQNDFGQAAAYYSTKVDDAGRDVGSLRERKLGEY